MIQILIPRKYGVMLSFSMISVQLRLSELESEPELDAKLLGIELAQFECGLELFVLTL